MDGQRDEAFRRFVTGSRRSLLRTAVLLTGDPARADDLVGTALLATCRGWGRDDPLTTARRALVAASTGRVRRAPARDRQVLTDGGVHLPGPDAARDEQVLAALRDLPARTRAAVVLRVAEDVPEAEAAALLGRDVPALRAETTDGVGRLQERLAALSPAGGGTARAEAELADLLAGAAWRGAAACPGDDSAAAGAVIARRRAAPRRAAVLALVVGLLGALAVHGLVRGAGTEPATPEARGSTAPAAAGVWPAAPRGSLAGDAAFLDTMRGRWWPDLPTPAPLPTRRVAFAGDVAGIRWVLVVGRFGGQLAGLWFTGPAGTGPHELVADGLQSPVIPGLALAGLRADATGATLLVVAQPGDDVQVSPAVTVDAAGTARRTWSSVDTRGGVASVREDGAYVGASLRYRVLRGGILAGSGPLPQGAVPADGLPVLTGQAARRAGSGTPAPAAFEDAVRAVLRRTGFGPADVAPVLLWSGLLPAPPRATAQASMVAMTMPSGAVVVSTAFADGGAMGDCGSVVSPAGTPADDLVAVTECDVIAATGAQRSFAVSAPPGYDHVELRSAADTVLVAGSLVGGAAALPDPGTVVVAVVTGPGRPAVSVQPGNPQHDVLDVVG